MFRKIASYSASIYAVTMGASALSFLVTMVIARRIPKEALGAYGFYVTIYALVGMLLCSGLNQSLVKFLGDKPENRIEVTRIVVAVFALLCTIFFPASFVAWSLGGGASWAFGFAAIPFSALIVLANSVFRAEFAKKNEIANKVAVSALNSLLTLGFAFLLAAPLMAPIWGDFLSMAIPGTVILGVFLWQGEIRGPGVLFALAKSPMVRRLLTFAIPLAIAGMAFVAYSNAASLLLRALAGLAALGEYYFALQLMNILEKPMTILASVVLAGFSRQPDISVREHKRLVGFNLVVFPLLAAGVAFGAPLLMQIADVVLGNIKGEPLTIKYAMAPAYVSLFALAVPARCVEFLVSTLAIARGRPDVNRNTHVITTSTCLPLLAGMVWMFGPWGAALMPLAYQLVFLSLQAWQLRALMPEIVAHTTRAAATSTLLLAGALALAQIHGAVFFFPLVAAVYLAAGHLLGAWDLKTLLPTRKSSLPPAPVGPSYAE